MCIDCVKPSVTGAKRRGRWQLLMVGRSQCHLYAPCVNQTSKHLPKPEFLFHMHIENAEPTVDRHQLPWRREKLRCTEAQKVLPHRARVTSKPHRLGARHREKTAYTKGGQRIMRLIRNKTVCIRGQSHSISFAGPHADTSSEPQAEVGRHPPSRRAPSHQLLHPQESCI